MRCFNLRSNSHCVLRVDFLIKIYKNKEIRTVRINCSNPLAYNVSALPQDGDLMLRLLTVRPLKKVKIIESGKLSRLRNFSFQTQPAIYENGQPTTDDYEINYGRWFSCQPILRQCNVNCSAPSLLISKSFD